MEMTMMMTSLSEEIEMEMAKLFSILLQVSFKENRHLSILYTYTIVVVVSL